MTNEQIKQHLERVVKTAKDIATKTCSNGRTTRKVE